MMMRHEIKLYRYYSVNLNGRITAVKVVNFSGNTLINVRDVSRPKEHLHIKMKDFRKEITKQENPEYFL